MRTEHLAPLALALLAASAPAAAQQSPWSLSGLVSVTHDDNLLRLGEGQSPGPGLSQSDTLTSTALVGALNQPFGRQRLQLAGTVRDNRFDRNGRYDNQSYSANASLDWSTINRISGQFSGGAQRALSTFNADVIGLLAEKNFETTRGFNASLGIGVVTAWTVEFSAGTRRTRNSLQQPTVQAQNSEQEDGSIGLAWRPSGLLETTLGYRQANVRFPNFRASGDGFVEDAFRRRGAEFGLRWRASGASLLQLQLSNSATRYGGDGSRDFDGNSGSITWQWQPTGKLGVNTRLARDRGQDNFPTFINTFFGPVPLVLSDLHTTESLRVQVDWAVSAKFNLSSSVLQSQRRVERRTLRLADSRLLDRTEGSDDTTIVTLGARWTPTLPTLLGCDLRRETRGADGSTTTAFGGTSIGCYAQLTWN
jgi:hypothetical protein